MKSFLAVAAVIPDARFLPVAPNVSEQQLFFRALPFHLSL
jgi:hypothetical protein